MKSGQLSRANTGQAEQAMRVAAIAFMEKRRGADVRVIHELVIGNRRIDLAFIYSDDIVGVEIKGPRDSLSDGRLEHQLREYNFYLPEVWLAVAPQWLQHDHVRNARNVIAFEDDGFRIHQPPKKGAFEPYRDEMCCSRILDRLWDGEARSIARRLGIVQTQLVDMMPAQKVKRILARLLSGQEIMREVCSELRSRPLTGIGSDSPRKQRGFSPPSGLADRFRNG